MPYRVHLDVLRAAEPCRESWDRMDGDDQVRFCSSCEKNVYRAKALSTAALAELLEFHEGSDAVRFVFRADETTVRSEPPTCETARAACERRRARARWKWIAVALLVIALAFAPFLRPFYRPDYVPPFPQPFEPIRYELGDLHWPSTPQSIPGTPFLTTGALEEQLRVPAPLDASAPDPGCSFVLRSRWRQPFPVVWLCRSAWQSTRARGTPYRAETLLDGARSALNPRQGCRAWSRGT